MKLYIKHKYSTRFTKLRYPILLILIGLALGFCFNYFFSYFEVTQQNTSSICNTLPIKVVMRTPLGSLKTTQYLMDKFPEIESSVVVEPSDPEGVHSRGIISTNSEDGGSRVFASSHYVGEEFFQIFPYDIAQGPRLLTKNSVYLSEKIALRLFNTTHGVIGKKIFWHKSADKQEYTISGIYFPNSFCNLEQFEVIFSIHSYENLDSMDKVITSYVALKEGVNSKQFNQRVQDLFLSNSQMTGDELFARRTQNDSSVN